MLFKYPIKPYLFLVIIFLIGQKSYGQCPSFVYINTQAEMDSFPSDFPGCTIISGDIEITKNVENLLGLSGITKIEGNLIISRAPNLISLAGLDNLTNVELIALTELESLTDLSAIENLEFANKIRIKQTAATQLPSFDKLVELRVTIQIIENHQLQQIHFPDDVAFDGQVEVVRNSEIKSITGFNGMKSATPNPYWAIMIRGNEKLETLEGFEKLETSGDIVIDDNAKLMKIPSFLELMKCTGRISIESNSALKEMIGFNKLLTNEGIIINNNNLEIIDGFSKLEKTFDLFIADEYNLKEFPSFPELKTIDRLYISDTQLDKISGFNNLDSVKSYLNIFNNTLLTEIDGFTNLGSVDNLRVNDNPLLSDCKAFCNYMSSVNLDAWASFYSNASGCNTLAEVNNSCNDTIGEVHIFDVILNTSSGSHTIDELADVSLLIYEGEDLKQSYFSDIEGLIEINLNKLDSTSKYRLEAHLGQDAVVKMKYEGMTLEMLSSDDFIIEYPDRLMDTIISPQKKLASKNVKAQYFGGAFELDYNLNGYDISDVEAPIIFFSEITENHTDVIEAMKRMGLGLHAVNLYLDDGIAYSNNMAKAFVESMFGLYKLIKDLNALKTPIGNLSTEDIAKEHINAIKAADLASLKFIWGFVRKYYINPNIASLENDPNSKQLASVIKKALVIIELKMFGAGGLTEQIFLEVVFNALGQYITEEYYVAAATQEQLNGLATSHENIEIGFPFLVNNLNSIRTLTEQSNATADFNADLYGGFSGDASNLADVVDNVGLGVTIATLGTGAPLGLGLRTLATGIKAGTLSLNGFNFLSYSERLGSLPRELNQITSEFQLNPPYQSGQYSQEFLDKLISELDIETLTIFLNNFKETLANDNSIEASTNYVALNTFLATEFENNIDALYSVISNMGSVAHLNGNPDDQFLAMEKEFRKINVQRLVIDLNMMAHISDLENDTIVSFLMNEVDTLQNYIDEIGNKTTSFFNDYGTGEYPPLISIASVTYPDTFLLESFTAEINIQNVGPLTSEPFNVILSPNEYCTLDILESQLEDLVLESGEIRTFEVEVTPLSEGHSNSIFLEFLDVRGINESIVFSFQDQILDFGGSTKTDDLIISKTQGISYPNPTNGSLFIKEDFLHQVDEYEIYDSQGLKVKTGNINTNKITLKELPAGVYVVSFKGKEKVFTEKIVKL